MQVLFVVLLKCNQIFRWQPDTNNSMLLCLQFYSQLKAMQDDLKAVQLLCTTY